MKSLSGPAESLEGEQATPLLPNDSASLPLAAWSERLVSARWRLALAGVVLLLVIVRL